MVRDLTKRRHEDCLYWYFQTLKDLGEGAISVSKSDLYAVAGEKVYLDEKTAARVIARLIKCPDAVRRATKKVI